MNRTLSVAMILVLVGSCAAELGFLRYPNPALGTPYSSKFGISYLESASDTKICGDYKRRVIDKTVKPAKIVRFNFDPMDPEAASKMSCSLRLFNGELKLNDPKQVPVQVNLAGTTDKKFDCSKDNSVEIPDKLSYQILTYEWQYQINGKSFSYCTDLYNQAGLASEKFNAKTAAQEYLDNLGMLVSDRQKVTNRTCPIPERTFSWHSQV